MNIHQPDILKVVSYDHTDDSSVQHQLDIRVLNNQQSRMECQRQLNDIAEDAFCAISTSDSGTLGVVCYY
jgi:hypothetical protein